MTIDHAGVTKLTVYKYSIIGQGSSIMNVTYLGPLAEKESGTRLPLYSFRVPAGFPSPAADHIEKHISSR